MAAISKRRNHYIPRVLLNRFASRADLKKKKYWIWRYQKDAEPMEISTKDIALGAYFYGREDSKLEDRLSKVEGELGIFLQKIDEGCDVRGYDRFLSDFAWVQAIRTRSFRDRFTRTFRNLLLRSAKHTGTDAAKSSLIRRGEAVLAEKLKALSPSQLTIAKQRLGGISLQEFSSAFLKQFVESGQFSSQLSQFVEIMSQSPILSSGMADGHNSALSTMFDEKQLSPEQFRASWRLFEFPARSLVLGDSCIYSTDPSGRSAPIGDAVSWHRIFFPISHSKCLVGEKSISSFEAAASEVNLASVGCSLRQFFAATDDLAHLATEIDCKTEIISDGELEEISRSAWEK